MNELIDILKELQDFKIIEEVVSNETVAEFYKLTPKQALELAVEDTEISDMAKTISFLTEYNKQSEEVLEILHKFVEFATLMKEEVDSENGLH